MRFDRLRRLSSLPAGRLEAALQRERVGAVLPVSELGSGRATVLAATPHKLAVATLRRFGTHHRWVIRWAPWDTVRMPEEQDPATTLGRPVIDIGGRRFGLVLDGMAGRAAVHGFRRYLRWRRRVLGREEVARTTWVAVPVVPLPGVAITVRPEPDLGLAARYARCGHSRDGTHERTRHDSSAMVSGGSGAP
jgi:hypothetical protein